MTNSQLDVSRVKASLPTIIVVCISFVSLLCSIFESRLNEDSHHWGLMYAMAVDVLNGLQPYLESLNPYGILASPINVIALKLFGNHIVSLGIAYGLIYSASLILIYFLLQQFLDKWLSALSILIIFLIHGHIIAPWPNYAYYAFLLLSLLLFTQSKKPFILLLSGALMALSVLARSTSFIAVLPPIFIYFFILYVGSKKLITIKEIAFFTLGLILPLAIFLLYLVSTVSFQSWSFQTFQLFSVRFFSIEFHSKDTSLMRYPMFFYVLAKNIVRGLIFGDLRLKLYSLAFFNNLAIISIALLRLRKGKFTSKDSTLLLFGLISTFGYLAALHDYQIFRLQSAAALGIGILIYSLNELSQLASTHRIKKLVLLVPCSFLVISLLSNFQFVPQSSYFEPWNLNLILSGKLREPQNIEILEGKLFEEKRASYYEEISQTMNEYSDKVKFLVNLTENSFIPFISDKYKRVQVAPFFALSTAASFRESEKARYEPLLSKEQAILFGYEGYKFEEFYGDNTTGSTTEIPANYKIIKSIENPDGNGKLIVAMPKS